MYKPCKLFAQFALVAAQPWQIKGWICFILPTSVMLVEAGTVGLAGIGSHRRSEFGRAGCRVLPIHMSERGWLSYNRLSLRGPMIAYHMISRYKVKQIWCCFIIIQPAIVYRLFVPMYTFSLLMLIEAYQCGIAAPPDSLSPWASRVSSGPRGLLGRMSLGGAVVGVVWIYSGGCAVWPLDTRCRCTVSSSRGQIFGPEIMNEKEKRVGPGLGRLRTSRGISNR